MGDCRSWKTTETIWHGTEGDFHKCWGLLVSRNCRGLHREPQVHVLWRDLVLKTLLLAIMRWEMRGRTLPCWARPCWKACKDPRKNLCKILKLEWQRDREVSQLHMVKTRSHKQQLIRRRRWVKGADRTFPQSRVRKSRLRLKTGARTKHLVR